MFNTLIPLLFALILLGYVFSGNGVPSDKPIHKLDNYNKVIQNTNSIPNQNSKLTLEEEVVQNMKDINNLKKPIVGATFHPILATSSIASSLD